MISTLYEAYTIGDNIQFAVTARQAQIAPMLPGSPLAMIDGESVEVEERGSVADYGHGPVDSSLCFYLCVAGSPHAAVATKRAIADFLSIQSWGNTPATGHGRPADEVVMKAYSLLCGPLVVYDVYNGLRWEYRSTVGHTPQITLLLENGHFRLINARSG